MRVQCACVCDICSNRNCYSDELSKFNQESSENVIWLCYWRNGIKLTMTSNLILLINFKKNFGITQTLRSRQRITTQPLLSLVVANCCRTMFRTSRQNPFSCIISLANKRN